MKSLPVIYPFLFALYPILALYAVNISAITIKYIQIPILLALAVTFLLWLGLNLIIKNKRKTGLLLLLILFLFFYYGHVQRILLLNDWRIGEHRYLLSIWGSLLLLTIFLIYKSKSDFYNHTWVLNLVIFVSLLHPLLKAIPYEFKRRQLEAELAQAKAIANSELDIHHNAGFETIKEKPDIYYIIFDRYANANVLQQTFDYDNSDFTDFLTERGFFVAPESQANYPKTFLSLASSLNLQYLDYFQVAKDWDDHTLVWSLLQEYKVWQFLQEEGYTFIHFGDWWLPTSVNNFADTNINYTPLGSNSFATLLLDMSVARPVIKHFIGDSDDHQRTRILYKFEQLGQIAETDGPKFVFAHMLIPHDPYIFGPNGEAVTKAETDSRTVTENYINQLTFANKQIKIMVDEILANSDSPPIIIIQSDEGPFLVPELLTPEFDDSQNWSRISPQALETHLKILNAYYLPGFDQDILYESISPVNTFRVIFNFYFGADFPLLEDKSYISEGDNLPYNFIEMPPASAD